MANDLATRCGHPRLQVTVFGSNNKSGPQLGDGRIPIHPSICLLIHLFIPSINPFICLSNHLHASILQSICPTVPSLCFSMHSSIHSLISLHVCPSIHPSIHSSIYPPIVFDAIKERGMHVYLSSPY